ncbi:cell wall protein DAN4-like [Haliotis rufescens]|uniref:cell wall protein DAN4-like n=1 Tax=Haliotis rufescens TaxID=6454 RepID=UPI00201F3672|nr:cell wall protein DAN4-like [Haliotis rufescens]
MDVLLTLVVLTLPSVISGLQTCSSGTETSSKQILLNVSTTQINTGGGMCSCRLTVSQTAQVEMFSNSWTQQCDTYMTIQKWRTSSECKNGIVQTIPGRSQTVNTGEEVWILVVATPGARGLSGQLQFKLKSSSVQLNIECFVPNTNSYTTTTPSTTLVSTLPLTFTTTTSPKTTAVTITTESLTSTPPHATETLRPTAITPQGQTTSVSTGLTAGPGTTKATFTTTQISMKGCQSRNNDFPGGIFAAGVATGAVLDVIAGAIYVVTSRRWWRSRQEKSDDIPVSEVHPTYSGLKPRTQEPSNTYDIIDPNPSKGTANPYINVP